MLKTSGKVNPQFGKDGKTIKFTRAIVDKVYERLSFSEKYIIDENEKVWERDPVGLARSTFERMRSNLDPAWYRVFKEEIVKHYKSGFPSVVKFLEEEGYLKYLSKEELEAPE